MLTNTDIKKLATTNFVKSITQDLQSYLGLRESNTWRLWHQNNEMRNFQIVVLSKVIIMLKNSQMEIEDAGLIINALYESIDSNERFHLINTDRLFDSFNLWGLGSTFKLILHSYMSTPSTKEPISENQRQLLELARGKAVTPTRHAMMRFYSQLAGIHGIRDADALNDIVGTVQEFIKNPQQAFVDLTHIAMFDEEALETQRKRDATRAALESITTEVDDIYTQAVDPEPNHLVILDMPELLMAMLQETMATEFNSIKISNPELFEEKCREAFEKLIPNYIKDPLSQHLKNREFLTLQKLIMTINQTEVMNDTTGLAAHLQSLSETKFHEYCISIAVFLMTARLSAATHQKYFELQSCSTLIGHLQLFPIVLEAHSQQQNTLIDQAKSLIGEYQLEYSNLITLSNKIKEILLSKNLICYEDADDIDPICELKSYCTRYPELLDELAKEHEVGLSIIESFKAHHARVVSIREQATRLIKSAAEQCIENEAHRLSRGEINAHLQAKIELAVMQHYTAVYQRISQEHTSADTAIALAAAEVTREWKSIADLTFRTVPHLKITVNTFSSSSKTGKVSDTGLTCETMMQRLLTLYHSTRPTDTPARYLMALLSSGIQINEQKVAVFKDGKLQLLSPGLSPAGLSYKLDNKCSSLPYTEMDKACETVTDRDSTIDEFTSQASSLKQTFIDLHDLVIDHNERLMLISYNLEEARYATADATATLKEIANDKAHNISSWKIPFFGFLKDNKQPCPAKPIMLKKAIFNSISAYYAEQCRLYPDNIPKARERTRKKWKAVCSNFIFSDDNVRATLLNLSHIGDVEAQASYITRRINGWFSHTARNIFVREFNEMKKGSFLSKPALCFSSQRHKHHAMLGHEQNM